MVTLESDPITFHAIQRGIEAGLLPCPFCGERPAMHRIGNEYSKTRKIEVRCPSCRIKRTDAALRYGFDWLESVAVKNWNTRTTLLPPDTTKEQR